MFTCNTPNTKNASFILYYTVSFVCFNKTTLIVVFSNRGGTTVQIFTDETPLVFILYHIQHFIPLYHRNTAEKLISKMKLR